jgi:hypothetical protein
MIKLTHKWNDINFDVFLRQPPYDDHINSIRVEFESDIGRFYSYTHVSRDVMEEIGDLLDYFCKDCYQLYKSKPKTK